MWPVAVTAVTDVVSLILWLWACRAVCRSWGITRSTTLTTLQPWVGASLLLWLLTGVCDLLPGAFPTTGRSYVTYLAAVVSLTPPIAVLGAQRPTCRAWPMFVLAPMVVVLIWPALAISTHAIGWRPLELETPHVVAFGLVALMGYGNYLGTRLSSPALLAGMLLTITVVAQSQSVAWSPETRLDVQSGCRLGLAIVILLAERIVRRPGLSDSRFQRVWDDFQTLFGTVWTRRLYDRLQNLAVKQHWNCQVLPTGFQWPEGPDGPTEAALEHAFRWLLRRFVDHCWLDERLGSQAAKAETPPMVSIDL